jgi:NCAIR mutase (PurE)-related protein
VVVKEKKLFRINANKTRTLYLSHKSIFFRISSEMYESVKEIPLSHGHLVYHPVANILSIIPSCLASSKVVSEDSMQLRKRIIVATAGTTDLPVAEEAAVVLEAANCKVERIYDVGVAGLHRVIRALPRLQSNEVGCVIVCAGMDGALPSVVGGLVSVPVIAVPTSIGYGVSLGGISALMTMLNSCAPGVSLRLRFYRIILSCSSYMSVSSYTEIH